MIAMFVSQNIIASNFKHMFMWSYDEALSMVAYLNRDKIIQKH